MNRREVIKSMGIISLHSLFPSVLAGFVSACRSGEVHEKQWMFFTPEEGLLIIAVIDRIIPATRTCAASEAGVHFFLDEVFARCMLKEQQELIRKGLSALAIQWNGEEDKTSLVAGLDEKAFAGAEEAAWFKTLKQYTLIGYFTGKEGTLKAGDYQKLPDGFVGEVPAGENTRAHSKTFLKFYF